MFKLIVMFTCIGKAITTAVINPNLTCGLIKEPGLLIRNDSTNQLMLLNASSSDVTSAIKVDLLDYKRNAVVQQTRNTLIIYYTMPNYDYMMKVHNLITGRSNGWFTYVGYIGGSLFFTLDDKLYFSKRSGGFMEYNTTQNKFVQSNNITQPSDKPDHIVQIESRPCFLPKSQQFHCYHSVQNEWKAGLKLLNTPSYRWIWSVYVYHNEVFICYYLGNGNHQCIVYNINTGNKVNVSDTFPIQELTWYDIPVTGVIDGGEYYVVINRKKQFNKTRLNTKEMTIFPGFTFLAIIKPCISSKKTTIVQLKGYATSTLNTQTTNDLKTTPKTGTNKVGSFSGGKMKKSTEFKFTATSTKPNKKDAICGTSHNTRGQIKNVSDDGKTARFECPIGYAIKDRPAVTIICHNGAWKYVYDAEFNLTCKRATIIVNEFGEPDDRRLFWDKIDECISNGTCEDREDAIGRWFPTSKYDKESKPKKSQPLLSSQTAGFIAMVIGLLTAAQALLEIILYVRKIRAARAAREAAGHSDDESTVTDEEEHEYYYEEYFVEEEVDDFYLPPANLS